MKKSDKFVYELHTHTSEVSNCGQAPAAEVVKNYVNENYNGIVVTDHLSFAAFRKVKDASWDEKVDYFMRGYHIAVETAQKLDKNFTVLLGAELRLENHGENDYLLYGMTEEFLRANPDIMLIDFKEMAKRVHEAGMLLVQAHPFREKMTIVNWRMLDGLEVYNGNSSHNSNNNIANMWAEHHGLIKTSSSDYHGMWGMHPGGIKTDSPILTNDELLATLRSRNYELI